MNTVKEFVVKLISLLIVASMLFAEFSIIGSIAISYAIDSIKTNNENVEITAYFENEIGQKVTEINQNTDKKLKLKIDVSVKNTQGYGGYFEGNIEVTDANFKILSEDEERIHVNAGETKTIEKEIEYVEIENMYEGYLSKNSSVAIKGKYVNSKGEYDIEGMTKVKVNWTSPEDTKAMMTMDVLTNKENLIQLLVEAKIENNSFPVKDTEVIIDVPEGTKDIKVHRRESSDTNVNYTVDDVNKKMKIEKAQGKLVITYEMEEETQVEGMNIKGESILTLCDEKILTSNTNVNILEAKDGIVSGEVLENESEFYKGKIYTGEDRIFTNEIKVNVDYTEDLDKIEISDENSVFMTETEDKKANIQYVTTKINKGEFDRIFGEEGYIVITDQSGSVIANVNKNSEVTEDGNIVIKYTTEITNIKMETSKPINVGTLKITNEKKLINSGYTREEIEKITGIKEKVIINTKETEAEIILKETESEANLDIENAIISTMSEEQKIRIIAKLNTQDESKDLYKNPNVKIVLPEEITEIKIESAQGLYKNGLETENAKFYKEDEKYVIEIQFRGEQQQYDSNDGAELHIDLKVKVDKLQPSKTDKIKLIYTNENKNIIKGTDAEIKFESQYGLMRYDEISNYNQAGEKQETYNTEELTANLDVQGEKREAKLKTILVNNYEGAISNIILEGKVPTGIENDTFKAQIKDVKVNNGNAVITYPEEGKYKVEIASMEKEERLEIVTTLEIPENMDYNQVGYLNEKVSYIHNNKEENNTLNVTLKTQEMLMRSMTLANAPATTTETNGLEISTVATSGGVALKDDAKVYEGQTIKYIITIKNNSETDYQNVEVKATQTNGKVWDLKKELMENIGTGEQGIEEHFYRLTDNTEIDLGIIEELKSGDSKTFEYEACADEINKDTETEIETYGTIYLTLENDTLSEHIDTIKNKIKDAEVKVTLNEAYVRELDWYSETTAKLELNIENISDKTLENVMVELILPQDMSYKGEQPDWDSVNMNNLEYVGTTINEKTKETCITYKILNITPGDTEQITILSSIGKITKNKNVNILAKVSVGEKEYISNEVVRTVYTLHGNVEVSFEAKTNENTKVNKDTVIESGNTVEFITKIKNNEEYMIPFTISDDFGMALEVKEATITMDGETEDVMTYIKDNYLLMNQELQGNKEMILNIKATVNSSYIEGNTVVNQMEITDMSSLMMYSRSIEFLTVKNSYFEKNDENTPQDDNPGDDNPQDDKPGDDKPGDDNPGKDNPQNDKPQDDKPTTEKKFYTISGKIWLDTNENGKMDTNEEKITNIVVRAISSDTLKIVETTQVANDGTYTLKLEEGKYIILFMYNNELYYITTYKTAGATEEENSNAVTRKVKIGENTIIAGVTDELELKSNLNNINLGLVNRKKFDLKLDKYVSKVIVTNAEGTKTYTQDVASKLAKVEINSKYLNGTSVAIEYKFRVTNVGEIAGYATNIVDYMPSDLSFNSSLNSDWYKAGENIYNASLANTLINPGETKEFTLILTKKMTTSNTGLINNQAKIMVSTNAKGTEDVTDDITLADVVIGISTGSTVSYIVYTIAITSIIGIVAYLISKKIILEKINI